MSDVQATFCATLVDEWVRASVRHAVVAPGSRSTPLALALVGDGRLDVQVHHDERCAAFMALGVGLATGRPAVLLCTSGTAATHFHAAVVEAHHAGVPLLACTADRPPELRDVGAPQAIDQDRLYGGAVRWSFDPGPPDGAMRGAWRSIAARAVVEAVGGGPVHLNLPFREPLVGDAGELPPGRDGGRPWHEPPEPIPFLDGPTIEGRALAVGAGWYDGDGVPTLLTGTHRSGGIAHADALLRVPALREELRPDVVVRSFRPPASRVVNEWLGATGADEHVVGPGWSDPSHTARSLERWRRPRLVSPPEWLARWQALDAAADAAIAAVLADHPEPTEPGTARTLLASLPDGAHLVVASSMPVRDLEWYAGARPGVTIHANRGANGIDGTISTAVGVALATQQPTTCLLGDIAFLHDSNALIGLAGRGVDLTIVVLDNDGGGIFSFLPQASSLGSDRFEQLFGTPHGVPLEALAAAHGVPIEVVRTDRAANVRLHEELNAAVADAVLRV